MGATKADNVEFVEELEYTRTLEHSKTLDQVETMGTVKLTDGAIVYIPAPTADPQDPRTFSRCAIKLHRLHYSARQPSDKTFLYSQLSGMAEVGDPGDHFML